MSDVYSEPYIWEGTTLEKPDFEHPTKVHDWRNHVGHHAKAIWHTFSHEQRLAIARDAEYAASNEDWD